MNVLIKAHHRFYPVDIASLWYNPSAYRWHGRILGDCEPFTLQTHGGPVNTNMFSAVRENFVIEDVDAADVCPFCGELMGRHRLDVTCPCKPKVCQHLDLELVTKGNRYFSEGEVVDNLLESLICKDCGKEFPYGKEGSDEPKSR